MVIGYILWTLIPLNLFSQHSFFSPYTFIFIFFPSVAIPTKGFPAILLFCIIYTPEMMLSISFRLIFLFKWTADDKPAGSVVQDSRYHGF